MGGAVEKCQDRDVLSARFGYEISGEWRGYFFYFK